MSQCGGQDPLLLLQLQICWFCIRTLKVIHTERWQKHTKRICDHVSHYPCWASESVASWAADEWRLNLQAISGIWLMLKPPGWGDEAASALQRPSSDLIPQRWHSSAPQWDEDTLWPWDKESWDHMEIHHSKKKGRKYLRCRRIFLF